VQSQVFDVVQRTLDHITEALSRGDTVELRNFGVLEVRLTRPRVGRNPNQPGSSFVIPPRATVKFKAGKVMRQRVEKLACSFPINENYFARQAFGRGYSVSEGGSLPPYLDSKHFDAIRTRCNRVSVRHESMTQFLSRSPNRSVNAFVLLDAQDWMSDQQLTDLWREINRSAAPGARVVFRTAADERLLPGRIPDEILDAWTYHEAQSRALNDRDRSSIYGGFHLYTLDAPA